MIVLTGCGKNPKQVQQLTYPYYIKTETVQTGTLPPDFEKETEIVQKDNVLLEVVPRPKEQVVDATARVKNIAVKSSIVRKSVQKEISENTQDASNAIKPAEPLVGELKPKTREEAQQRARKMYEEAQKHLSAGKNEEALRTVERALMFWENGSLYVLKARCLNNLGGYESAAKTAAERAVAKGEFWEPESRKSALEQKLMALQSAYKKTPSQIIIKEINETNSFLH